MYCNNKQAGHVLKHSSDGYKNTGADIVGKLLTFGYSQSYPRLKFAVLYKHRQAAF